MIGSARAKTSGGLIRIVELNKDRVITFGELSGFRKSFSA